MKKDFQKKQKSSQNLLRNSAVKAGIVLLLFLLFSTVPVAASSYYLGIDMEDNSFDAYPCYVVFTFSSTGCSNLSVDFGDDSQLVNLTGTSQMLAHTYVNPGTYMVVLSGITGNGAHVSTAKEIVVRDFETDGILTVNTDNSSYWIGDAFTVSGRNTYSDSVALYIRGTNFRLTSLTSKLIPVAADGSWNITLHSHNITEEPLGHKKMDVGTYTITAVASDGTFPNPSLGFLYANTTAVAFKQPYVGGLTFPSEIPHGDTLEITGTATGTDSIMYYIFGLGNLTSGIIPVGTDDTFSFDIDTSEFNFGSYSLVLQHPMYDRMYNIGPVTRNEGEVDIMLNTQGPYTDVINHSYLFNVNERQSINAAQALCDALDSQNIDDMYIKSSFVVYPNEEETNVITLESYVTQEGDGLQYSVFGFCTSADSVSFYLQYPDGNITAVSEHSTPCNSISAYSANFTVPNTTTAGKYTLFSVTGNPEGNISDIITHPHASSVYELGLTGIQESDVVMRGTPARISGTTTEESELRYYLFGPSYFETDTLSVIEGTYNFLINTNSLDIGPYSVVVQASGSDSIFNIGPVLTNENWYIMMNREGAYTDEENSSFLFNVYDIPSAYVANVLCDVFETQNIDDDYLAFSFTVTGKIIALHSVSDVKLGQNLSVSGTAENIDAETVTLVLNSAGSSSIVTTASAIISEEGTWSSVLDTRELPIGDYLLTVSADGMVSDSQTFSIRENLPSLMITDAKEMVVKGDSVSVSGLAEGALLVQYYLFGTNFFKSGSSMVVNNTYDISISSNGMSAGQYFMVIQHPMEDSVFNIGPVGTEIMMNPTGSYTVPYSTVLFDVSYRQTANAAQALCDALDTQNIDDMYVKYSFFIVGQDASFSISEIPSEVTKGTQIVISGVSTPNAGKTVTVEMLSTAFAAVPKETVGSASFIVVTTRIADDGTWEVVLDTSDLNVDEYSVNIACDGKSWKNVGVDVIDSAPTPTPTVEPTVVPTDTPVPTPQPETLTKLQLLEGWNFISVQKALDASNNTAEKIFGGVDTGGNAILGYDAASQMWEQMTASAVIKPLTGYWIYSNESATVSLYYSETPVSPAVKDLYKGWNAVGLSAGSDTVATSAFAGIDWRTVLPWNLEKGSWGKPLVNGGNGINSAEQYLSLGNGSWLYVEADGTLVGLIA